MNFRLVIVKVHFGGPRELVSRYSDLGDQIEYTTSEEDTTGTGVTDSACTFLVGLVLLQLRNG